MGIPGSVVKDWLSELPWKMQTVLLAGFRGCDGKNKEDPSKPLARMLRMVILKDADPTTSFMDADISEMAEHIKKFVGDLDHYPMHWLLHFTHACEIVGYFHPDKEIQLFFLNFYMTICIKGLHMGIESEQQLIERLS